MEIFFQLKSFRQCQPRFGKVTFTRLVSTSEYCTYERILRFQLSQTFLDYCTNIIVVLIENWRMFRKMILLNPRFIHLFYNVIFNYCSFIYRDEKEKQYRTDIEEMKKCKSCTKKNEYRLRTVSTTSIKSKIVHFLLSIIININVLYTIFHHNKVLSSFVTKATFRDS